MFVQAFIEVTAKGATEPTVINVSHIQSLTVEKGDCVLQGTFLRTPISVKESLLEVQLKIKESGCSYVKRQP